MDEIEKLIAGVERLGRERQRLSAAAMVSLTAARRYVELTVCAADAAPLLAAEVRRLRAELDSANAAVDAAFAARDQYMQGQTEATAIARDLRADLEEARLTLAAEQGRQEVAPYDCPEMVLAMVNGERIRRGLSWRELATILGVSPSTLTRWTHGKMLSVPAYLRVCKWLNATNKALKAGSPS